MARASTARPGQREVCSRREAPGACKLPRRPVRKTFGAPTRASRSSRRRACDTNDECVTGLCNGRQEVRRAAVPERDRRLQRLRRLKASGVVAAASRGQNAASGAFRERARRFRNTSVDFVPGTLLLRRGRRGLRAALSSFGRQQQQRRAGRSQAAVGLLRFGRLAVELPELELDAAVRLLVLPRVVLRERLVLAPALAVEAGLVDAGLRQPRDDRVAASVKTVVLPVPGSPSKTKAATSPTPGCGRAGSRVTPR